MFYIQKKKLDPNSISCVISTHNRDDYLKDAVNSVINQTQPPLEIIVSNNLPNEKTKNIILEISKKTDVPIQYIEHHMKGRGSISMNLAVNKSKGDFIAFLDDDDMWEKEYLKKMSLLISSENNKILYSWFSKLQDNQKAPYKQLKENLQMSDFLLKNPGSVVSNLIVARELFIGIGGFDDYAYSNDKDFIIRAIYFGNKYSVLKENMVIQRKHGSDQLTDVNRDFLIGIKKFFKKHEFIASKEIKVKFWIKYFRLKLILFLSGKDSIKINKFKDGYLKIIFNFFFK